VSSDKFTEEHREVFVRLLTDEPCLLIDPSVAMLSALAAHTLADPSALPETRVSARRPVLKTVRGRLSPATALAEGIVDGSLAVRVLGEPMPTTVLATPSQVHALVDIGEGIAALATDAAPFVDDAWAAYDKQFTNGEQFDLRRPSRSELIGRLADRVSEAAAAEFKTAVDGADRIVGLDAAISLALVVAARNEQLLYDLGRWSEGVSLASKATVSRQKGRLVDAGLLETEKQPIDIGRPRLRLTVAADALVAVEAANLWSAIRDRLPET
jgi:hypothetical protein